MTPELYDQEYSAHVKQLLTLSNETLGALIKEYIEESAHSSWEGFSEQEQITIYVLLRDINTYNQNK